MAALSGAGGGGGQPGTLVPTVEARHHLCTTYPRLTSSQKGSPTHPRNLSDGHKNLASAIVVCSRIASWLQPVKSGILGANILAASAFPSPCSPETPLRGDIFYSGHAWLRKSLRAVSKSTRIYPRLDLSSRSLIPYYKVQTTYTAIVLARTEHHAESIS